MENELKAKAREIQEKRYLIDSWEEWLNSIEDLLKEKRNILEVEEPYATRTIDNLRNAEETIRDLYWDIYS